MKKIFVLNAIIGFVYMTSLSASADEIAACVQLDAPMSSLLSAEYNGLSSFMWNSIFRNKVCSDQGLVLKCLDDCNNSRVDLTQVQNGYSLCKNLYRICCDRSKRIDGGYGCVE